MVFSTKIAVGRSDYVELAFSQRGDQGKTMTLGKRIKRAMTFAKIKTQAELAEKVTELIGEKVNQQTINAAITDRSKTTAYAVPIAIVCGVSAKWLALGIGEITAPEQPLTRLDGNAKELLQATIKDTLDHLKKYRISPTNDQTAKVIVALFDRFLPDHKVDHVALQDTLDLVR
ncbi:MAG: hypothetical protein MJA83_10285 [Gammaproteobacteria bacterium]|nr:hypothetical protein [Gammaproteobacteria bacterium]